MKNHAPRRAAVAVASLTLALCATPAFALVELGGGVLKVDVVGSVTYDDNIRGQSTGQNDVIASLTPTFTYKRAEGRVSIELHAMSSFASYSDASNQNHTDYSVGGSANLPFSDGSPMSGSLSFDTSKSTEVQPLVNDLVSTKTLTLATALGYQYSERLGINSSLHWGKTSNEGLGDNRTIGGSLGLSLPQLIFRRLPLTLTYSYTGMQSEKDTTTSNKLDNDSHSFSLGTSGQLTARTSGTINVGWTKTKSSGTEATNGDTSSINVGTSLIWQASELLSATLSANRGITASPTNDTVLNSTLQLSFARKLSHTLDGSLSLSQTWNDFQNTNRSDKVFAATGSLAYKLTRTWSSALTATHSKNSSDLASASFDRNVVALSFTLQF